MCFLKYLLVFGSVPVTRGSGGAIKADQKFVVCGEGSLALGSLVG